MSLIRWGWMGESGTRVEISLSSRTEEQASPGQGRARGSVGGKELVFCFFLGALLQFFILLVLGVSFPFSYGLICS